MSNKDLFNIRQLPATLHIVAREKVALVEATKVKKGYSLVVKHGRELHTSTQVDMMFHVLVDGWFFYVRLP